MKNLNISCLFNINPFINIPQQLKKQLFVFFLVGADFSLSLSLILCILSTLLVYF